jgi:DNA-3-methyladenine glycosylase II
MLITPAAHRALKTDPVMAGLIRAAVRYEPDERLRQSPFEVLARAIAHQQLHANAARNILNRFVALFEGGLFPLPQHVIDTDHERLRAVGFSGSKVAALKDLATKALLGVVPNREALDALSDEQIIERLTQVRGVGRWTVEMMLMFQLQRPDVLPVDDFGVRNGFRLAYGLRGMPTPKALAQYGERWQPYRSIAAWYLWRANDLAKQELLPKCAQPPRLQLQKARPAPAKRAAAKRAAAKRPRVTAKRTGKRAAPKTARRAKRVVRRSVRA